MVAESIINIVKQYIKELQEKGLVFEKVILYGSQAKGTATEDSDIDVMLVSKLFDGNHEKYASLVWWSDIGIENRIEPFMMGYDRFTNGFSPLIDAAKYEGIEIQIN